MFTKREFLASSIAALSATPMALLGDVEQQFVLEERFQPQIVRIRKQFVPGEILILPQSHFLYLVMENRKALRFGVGVGKAGLAFKGQAIVERKAKWPSWRPTDEMIAREPHKYARFSEGVPGGPNNPLGARALYLYRNGVDTYFRIHGTSEPNSIGRSVSNGCIRMLNEHVKDLYERVPVGTRVTVL